MRKHKPDQRPAGEPKPAGVQRARPIAGADTRQALWSLGVVIAFAVILGVTFYGFSSRETQTATSPSTNAPALAGERPPAATTGQGGSRDNSQSGKTAK